MAESATSVTTPEGFLVEGPVSRGLLFVVTVTDPLTGESKETEFPSRGRATGWIAQQLMGCDPKRARAPSKPSSGFENAQSAQLTGAHRPKKSLDGRLLSPQERAESPRFAIRPVKEVLEQYGLDPTAELARLLTERKPVVDKSGKPLFERDENGEYLTDEHGEMVPMTEPVLPASARSMLLIELQQYVTPKLRAVEMKAEVKEIKSDAEIDSRIAAIVAAHPELASVVASATAAASANGPRSVR